MKYLKIILNGTVEQKLIVLDGLRTTTTNLPIVHNGELFLQLNDEAELVGEVFSLGMLYSDALRDGIDDPFDFEIVTAVQLPLEVAMKMN